MAATARSSSTGSLVGYSKVSIASMTNSVNDGQSINQSMGRINHALKRLPRVSSRTSGSFGSERRNIWL